MQLMIITLPEKGTLQICNNYSTISLISHPSKVMLKVLLNRLKPQGEEMVLEQAGARLNIYSTWESSVKNIYNTNRIYTMFSLTLRKRLTGYGMLPYGQSWDNNNIGNKLIHVIKSLYERATSAVFINGNIGEWFHTTVGVRQGCNIFLERIMSGQMCLKNTKEQSA